MVSGGGGMCGSDVWCERSGGYGGWRSNSNIGVQREMKMLDR